MNRFFFAFQAVVLFLGINGFAQLHPARTKTFSKSSSAQVLRVRVIPSIEHTWGYDIYADGRLYIHQPAIPGYRGNAGFSSKSIAQKAAKLVCSKIRAGIIPPTLTMDELKHSRLIPQ